MNGAVVKIGTHGQLKDGKSFLIKDFEKLHICKDGSIHSGTVSVIIDGKYVVCCVSHLAKNINYASLPTDIVV